LDQAGHRNRIKNGEIEAHFNSSVQEIGIDHVVINTPHGPMRLKNDFVLALIGTIRTTIFCAAWGSSCRGINAARVRSSVAGEQCSGNLCAGVIVAGSRTNEIFIENGRFHGKQIAEDLKNCLRRDPGQAAGPLHNRFQ